MTAQAASAPWTDAVAVEADSARCWILEQVEQGAAREIGLEECAGLVVAGDVVAAEPLPAFDTSAMDGYATHPQPGPSSTWRVVGRALAGNPFDDELQPGEAIRIMTGARVPSSAAAVVPLELVTEVNGLVTASGDVRPGANIRARGSDHDVGDLVVAAGTRLNAAHVAVLASIGHDRPQVIGRPRVGVMSTGDEVAGTAEDPSSIRDANRPGLIALVRKDGATPVDLGVVGDDAAELARRLEPAVDDCDAVILTGGVSVGDHDHVKHVLAELAERSAGVARWMRVAVRPAKPLMFATIGGVPVFGLPGNPASAFVSYHLFARPVLDRLAGDRSSATRRAFCASAACDMARVPDGRLHVVPVVADIIAGRMSVRPVGSSTRHHLAATATANAYAHIPDGPPVRAGELVECSWM